MPAPIVRRLRVYAFDPQSSVELATAVINDAVIELPWETRFEDPVEPGPVNDYLEVIDYDPSSDLFYAPVDLNDPMLLAQDGLPPSEGRPQFHQQMVFAVAMRTIRAFERALGRLVVWAGDSEASRDSPDRRFTKRLRIYPHALLEANAYYSPQKRALLFGYFKQPGEDADTSSWVFTCLSQDIVAHETTHAILHGLQQRSIEGSNPDALAFHEAFADIVALMQHFTMLKVVCHQLEQSRGSLREANLLNGLALQFGTATGRQGALRYALEYLEEAAAGRGEPPKLSETYEPHARGGILVAAVFDAFVTVYESRTADLFRLARGRGELGRDMPGELIKRCASEAAKAADQVLRMCVRALDYIPPVDLHFGEYLRALITADTDLVPNDPMRYRVAFVEAFKKRGIMVPGCISMAPDSLLWDAPDLTGIPEFPSLGFEYPNSLSTVFRELLGELQLSVMLSPTCTNMRQAAIEVINANQRNIHDWFARESPEDEGWEKLLGMRLLPWDAPRKIRVAPVHSLWTGEAVGGVFPTTPKVEVHSARIARRAGPDGQEVHQLIIQVTQKRRGYDKPTDQQKADAGDLEVLRRGPDFWFRGGATLHVDLRDGRLMRIIRKSVLNDARLERQRQYRNGDTTGRAVAFKGLGEAEPFAFMHRSAE